MSKSDKLKLFIVGPGAASNFIGSRIWNTKPTDLDSDTNEYRTIRDYSDMPKTVLLDYIKENTIKKENTLYNLKRIARLLDSYEWVTGIHHANPISPNYTIAMDKIEQDWEKIEYSREPVFWVEVMEMGMNDFRNNSTINNFHGNLKIIESDWWTQSEKFLSDWYTLGWLMHYKKDYQLHSIEHYLSVHESDVDKIAEVANIGVLHVDASTTSFITDILNMKHMTANIENNISPVPWPLLPNKNEMRWADLVLDYRKLFCYNDTKELYNLFDFFDKGEYFKDNQEKETKAFHDYHMANVKYFTDNWKELTEENT